MGRFLLRLALAFVALVALGAAAVVLLLPRILATDAARERLEAAARDATGQEVRWDELRVGVFPPRVIVVRPRLASAGGAAPQVSIERVDLRVAVPPLFSGSLVIDSLLVDGVSLRAVRTAAGIALPVPPVPPPGEVRLKDGASDSASGVSVAIERVRLTGGRVELEDRTVEPAALLALVDLEVLATGGVPGAPIDLEGSGTLAGGGALSFTGRATLAGSYDVDATLDGVALAALRPYLPPGLRADDAVDVAIRAAGDGSHAPALELDVDATAAAVEFGRDFRKPAGVPLTLTARLGTGGEATALEEGTLVLRDLRATARGTLGARTSLEIDTEPVDLAGWDQLLPALAGFAPGGHVRTRGLRISLAPLALGGRIELDDVSLRPPPPRSGAPVVLRGALEGNGTGLHGVGLEAHVAGERIPLQLDVTQLETKPRYRLQAQTEQAELNALLTALAGLPDTVSGPLDSRIDLAGEVGGDRPPIEAVRGKASIAIGRGQLRGVSLLEGTMDRLGAVGQVALAFGSAAGGRTMQRFYADEFESITGTFEVGDGKARTNDLRLVYRHYTVDLHGALGLSDESLDFGGTIWIEPEVDAAIAESAAGGSARQSERRGERRAIPLAHVGGTLSRPRITLTRQAAVAFLSDYAFAPQRRVLERTLDRTLGEGAGRQLMNTLEGILGGGRRPEPPPPPSDPPSDSPD